MPATASPAAPSTAISRPDVQEFDGSENSMIARIRCRQSPLRHVVMVIALVVALVGTTGLAACGPSSDGDPPRRVRRLPCRSRFAGCPVRTPSCPEGRPGVWRARGAARLCPSRGEQITLQIIRARHKEQSDRIGSVIFNPGGPGDPGLEYTPFLLSWLPESVLKRFDLVSLDPRGTGGSAPINCPAVPDDPDTTTPNVLTKAGFARAVTVERQQSQACIQALSSRAPHFTTQTAARDIDRLRAAVGDQSPDLSRRVVRGEARRRICTSVPDLGARGRPRRTVGARVQPVRQHCAADQGLRGRLRRVRERLRDRPTCSSAIHMPSSRGWSPGRTAAPIPSRRASDERPADGSDVLDAMQAPH